MDYCRYLQQSDGVPNLIAVVALSGVVVAETKGYLDSLKKK